MAVLIGLLVVSLFAGLALSFGPAGAEAVLHWGASVNAVSLEIVIITVVMIGLLIVLWGINAIVRKEDGWFYSNVVPDGKAEAFAVKAKKVINVLVIVIVVFYVGLVAVMLLSNVMETGEMMMIEWREVNAELLDKLAWIGNMCLSAGAAFLVSIATIRFTPALRRSMRSRRGRFVRNITAGAEAEGDAGNPV